MARKWKGKGKRGVMTKALGRMVGLLLSLYVFDQIAETVLPLMCKVGACDVGYGAGTSCTIDTWNASAASDAVCVWVNSSGGNASPVASGSTFATAVVFLDNILPVVGILGAFEIIYSSLKASKLL